MPAPISCHQPETVQARQGCNPLPHAAAGRALDVVCVPEGTAFGPGPPEVVRHGDQVTKPASRRVTAFAIEHPPDRQQGVTRSRETNAVAQPTRFMLQTAIPAFRVLNIAFPNQQTLTNPAARPKPRPLDGGRSSVG